MSKRKGKAKDADVPGDRTPLVAWSLASLISDPATPADLYNRIIDWLGEVEADYHNELRGDTHAHADHLTHVLNHHAGKAGK